MFKLDLEKAEEPEIKLRTYVGSQKKQENSRKTIYFCFIDYTKDFYYVDHNKLWKIRKELGVPDHPLCLPRNLYVDQEAAVRTVSGSKLGKEYDKAAYYHSAYLTSMQSTSQEMPGWMKDKLKSRLPGEISTTSDMQIMPP